MDFPNTFSVSYPPFSTLLSISLPKPSQYPPSPFAYALLFSLL